MRTHVALLATLALSAFAAAPAAADTLTCGAVITHDTVLDNDLFCIPPFRGTMITIAASGITLDLNGHGISSMFAPGIRSEGNNRVTIRNGLVGTQGTAISMSGDHNLLSNLVGGAFDLHDGRGSRLVDVSFRSVSVGGILRNERHVVVERSNSDVINLFDTDHSSMRDSSGAGVTLDAQSQHNKLLRNTFTHNASLQVDGDHNTVEHNALDGLFPIDPLEVGGDHNRVAWNTVRHSRGDGIDVNGTGNVIRGNGAFVNAALGIFAAPGNTDGGFNRASGNGDPRQCVGVVCTSKGWGGWLAAS